MVLDRFKLDEKVAIVTGGATGLGRGMTLGLAEAGAHVVVVGSSESDSGIVTAIEKRGRKGLYLQANLMSTAPIQGIIDQAVETFGHVDILINNAGIIRREDAVNFSEQDWDDVMNVNVKTVFFFSQAVANQFLKQETGGKIINIASMLSFQGGIRVPSYTASKSGVKGITMSMANEWAKHGININAIAPGYMATDNTAQLRADASRNTEILGRIPANRWGDPEDLAGAAVFLASQASDYINGYTLAVDGGWLAR
ncbi:MAG: 2-dehydro-3-deoxy-D-gluconate 5-dehydrogenase KduD [Defluviitaleaceae bacterium]|nr:2-dehydro-3-deoxy-D-gluconate 5-dehydrogenase KduD [Defluviitaleaceae bacterium]